MHCDFCVKSFWKTNEAVRHFSSIQHSLNELSIRSGFQKSQASPEKSTLVRVLGDLDEMQLQKINSCMKVAGSPPELKGRDQLLLHLQQKVDQIIDLLEYFKKSGVKDIREEPQLDDNDDDEDSKTVIDLSNASISVSDEPLRDVVSESNSSHSISDRTYDYHTNHPIQSLYNHARGDEYFGDDTINSGDVKKLRESLKANKNHLVTKYDRNIGKAVRECTLCGVILLGEKAKSDHVSSSGHSKKVNGSKTARHYCKECECSIVGEDNIKKHKESENHKRKEGNWLKLTKGEKLSEREEFTGKTSVTASTSISSFPHEPLHVETSDIARCNYCESSFKNEHEVKQHIQSANHILVLRPAVSDLRGDGGEKLARCVICNNKMFNGFKTFNDHLLSSDHVKKLDNSGIDGQKFSCICCKIDFVSDSEYRTHLLTKVHELHLKNLIELMKDDPKRGQKLQFSCELCEIVCCGLKNFQIHLRGKSHSKIQKSLSQAYQNQGNVFKCQACNQHFPVSGYTTHIWEEVNRGKLYEVANTDNEK